jgi:hypothetical protein
VGSIRHVGKEGNELEAHRAGLVTEAERQLEYHDSTLEDLIAKLQQIPTKVIAEATGYNPRTVRRLKRGEFKPSAERLADLTRLVSGIVTKDPQSHDTLRCGSQCTTALLNPRSADHKKHRE